MSNIPTVKTCFEQISRIIEDERNNFEAKLLKLEEEKGVLYGLLQNRNDLEKENGDVKTENKVLKEEISFLRLTLKESEVKLCEQVNKYELYKKTMTRKQLDWARFAKVVRKNCTCKFSDVSLRKSNDSSISTPSVKIKNVSNVFFMSPVKSKTSSDNRSAMLAPMTEEYHADVQHFKASTPMVVGETERSPRLYYEGNSSDESDDEEVGSPSLFADHDSRCLFQTPVTLNRYKKEKHLKTVSIDLCKPSPMDRLTLASPMDRLTLASQKHERRETSGVLFSDDGNKVSDVSSESNVDFQRSSGHMPNNQKVKASEIVKWTDEEEQEEEENEVVHRNVCSKEKEDKNVTQNNVCSREPLQPVLKKRKYVSQEEVDEAVHQKNISNTNNNNNNNNNNSNHGNQTWITSSGNNVINPRNNTTNPMVNTKEKENKSKQNDKSKKNVLEGIQSYKNNNKVNYKHSTVVRKKHEREKLNGFACEECRRYYESDKLTKEQLEEVLKNCSRHKHVSAPPPSTPEQFWALDFPQTQDCIDKGYMLDENQTLPDHVKPKYKRNKKKKSVNFK